MRVERALSLRILADLVSRHFMWDRWETMIQESTPVIDRPRDSRHPTYDSIVYPIDYGYLPGTLGSDGEPVDVFVGTAPTGLVGAILTVDFRRKDREVKLLYDCSPTEVYVVNGFINYDPSLMRGFLAMRQPMQQLWVGDTSSHPQD